MAAAITDFLRTATSLHQQVSQAESQGDGYSLAVRDVPRLIREFEALVDRLAWSIDASEPPGDTLLLQGLSRACWKVSQDVLLRLKGSGGAVAVAAADATGQVGAAWPTQDVETFGIRVSDLRSQWSVLQPSDT